MAEKEVQSLLHCVYTLCNAATRNAGNSESRVELAPAMPSASRVDIVNVLLVQKPIIPNKKNGLGISKLPNPFICNVLLLSTNIIFYSEMYMASILI